MLFPSGNSNSRGTLRRDVSEAAALDEQKAPLQGLVLFLGAGQHRPTSRYPLSSLLRT